MASTNAEFSIRQLPPSAANDPATLTKLVNIINTAYTETEADLLVEGRLRTNLDELSAYVRAGEIHVATNDTEITGCVKIRRIDQTTAGLGMLAVPAAHRKAKLGSRLVGYAEATAREMGCRTMQLELLMPRHQAHEFKNFLKRWYMKFGYGFVRRETVEEFLPHLVDIMVVPVDFEVYEKDL